MTEPELRSRILEETYKARKSKRLLLQTGDYCRLLGLNPDNDHDVVMLTNALEYLTAAGFLRAEEFHRHAAVTICTVKELLPLGVEAVERATAEQNAVENADHQRRTDPRLFRVVGAVSTEQAAKAADALASLEPADRAMQVQTRRKEAVSIFQTWQPWWLAAGLPLAGIWMTGFGVPTESRALFIALMTIITASTAGVLVLGWIAAHEKATGASFPTLSLGVRLSMSLVAVAALVGGFHPWSRAGSPSTWATAVPRRALPSLSAAVGSSSKLDTKVLHRTERATPTAAPLSRPTPITATMTPPATIAPAAASSTSHAPLSSTLIAKVIRKGSGAVVQAPIPALPALNASRIPVSTPPATATPLAINLSIGLLEASPLPAATGSNPMIHLRLPFQIHNATGQAIHVRFCGLAQFEPTALSDLDATAQIRRQFATTRPGCAINPSYALAYAADWTNTIFNSDVPLALYQTQAIYYVGELQVRADDGSTRVFPICGSLRQTVMSACADAAP